MANIFNRQSAAVPQLSPRAVQENKYNSARYNLLGVIAFTAINIIMVLLNTGRYFLFSAFAPYYIADLGMYVCDKYPAEYYNEFFQPVENPLPDGFLIAMVAVAVIILLAYLLCFIFSSKQRVGWLIASLVLFGLDTVGYFLIVGFDPSGILDILFHAWVLYYLISGILAYNKLKNLPEDAPVEAADFTVSETVAEEPATETAPATEAAPANEAATVENAEVQE